MKRTIFTAITAMLVLSTAISAQAAHTHEYTRQNSKVYVCECGKEKPMYSLKGEKVVTLNCSGGSLYGGIYKTDITEMITEQNKIKLPLPYRSSDYQFEGWFTESGEKMSSDNEYYSDTTLYAHWSLTGTRTLTFAAEDGSYIEPVIKPLGTTISLAEFIPTRYGYDLTAGIPTRRQKKTVQRSLHSMKATPCMPNGRRTARRYIKHLWCRMLQPLMKSLLSETTLTKKRAYP